MTTATPHGTRFTLLACGLLIALTLLLEQQLPAAVNTDFIYVLAVIMALRGPHPWLVWLCAGVVSLLTLADWLFFRDPGTALIETANATLALLAIWGAAVFGLRFKDRANQHKIFSRMLDQSPVSVMLTDPRGHIVYVNPQFTRTTGYTAAEALGQTPRLLRGGNTPIEVYQSMWQTISRGENWSGQLRNRRKDSTEYWEMLTISPLRNQTGMISHYIAIMEDVTERIAREHQQAHLQQLEIVGRLTSGIAHDFNNLLTIIIGNLHFLRGDKEGDELEIMDDALSAAEDGAQLCTRLLAFSRHHEPVPELLDVATRLQDLEKMLRRLVGESYELALEIGSPLGQVILDPVQFDSALVNLVINARDAMPQGGSIHIAARQMATTGNGAGPACQVRVRDTGSGIPTELLQRVTEPFFTTKDDAHGTGLGLSMVKAFIERSGGDLAIESAVGQGTSVILSLPMAGDDWPGPDTRAQEEELPGGHETILLVEDNPLVRRSAARLLQGLGYRVSACADAASALQRAQELPDLRLLFSDIKLAGATDGDGLAVMLQRQRPDTLVLLTTGLLEYQSPHRYPLIRKPYTPQTLAKTLRELLD